MYIYNSADYLYHGFRYIIIYAVYLKYIHFNLIYNMYGTFTMLTARLILF